MDWLRQAAERRPDAPAVIAGGSSIAYGELDELATRVAGAVRGAGPVLGERVAYWGEQNLRSVAAAWGVPRSGAWAVPLSTRLPAAEAMALTRRAGVQGLWALASEADLDGLRPTDPVEHSGPPASDARYVIFTSGTTGRPEGIVLSGSNIEAAVAASQANLGNGPDDPWLCVLPTSHVGGLSILWRCAAVGAPVVLQERFDAPAATALLANGEVAYASLVPTMLRRVLELHPGPYEGLKGVLVGGGPADGRLIGRALDAGIPALTTYGSTETCSQVATVTPGDEKAALGTAGRPLDGFEVRIGEDGRIEVRGEAVATETIDGPLRDRDEWLPMGDIGSFDDEGRLAIAGRADRMIVTGGVNVHPDAIEAVLAGHPSVADVHVSGTRHPEWGMAVTAEIMLVEGAAFDERTIAAWCRARMPGHQVPKAWVLVAEIARTELGKRPA